jgi:hypothetical protein
MSARRTLLFLLVLSLLLAQASLAEARSRPDQVLVLYNQDWTQDLDGSDPGQDSEELARYYVKRRTDPETGRKPWMLGLTAGKLKPSPLSEPILKERSSDNWLGLVYKGEGEMVADPWPLSSAHGNATIPFKDLEAGWAPRRLLTAFLPRKALGGVPVTRIRVTATRADGQEAQLVGVDADGREIHPSSVLVALPTGLLVAIDLRSLAPQEASYRVAVELENGTKLALGTTARPPPEESSEVRLRPMSDLATPLAQSGFFDRLLSAADLVALIGRGNFEGIYLTKQEVEAIDPATLRLIAGPRSDPFKRVVLFDGRAREAQREVALWRVRSGGMLLTTSLARYFPGTVQAEITSEKAEGAAFRKSLVFHDIEDFAASDTGPDGVRDDEAYLRLIEEPVKEFLESHVSDDGIPLKDHILYIVVVKGLPYQVRSLWGIHRGVTNANRGDLGGGSALTQRLRMPYYEVPNAVREPGIITHQDRDRVSRPTIGVRLRQCLIGPAFNPYLHPLTHNAGLRERTWTGGGLKAVAAMDPPHLTTAYRKQMGESRFLYGASRIDAAAMEQAFAQIDGAIYAEHYLTPKLGPSFIGKYQEAPATGELLRARGFEVRPLEGPADRALFYFGYFGTGVVEEQDPAKHPVSADSPVWCNGFLPGSVGYPIKSFLGWDRPRPPVETVQLFEQVIRNGITASAGSSGGAHDTNLTWPDSFVLTHLLLQGYELGDAVLRGSFYLDWTLSLVGDPLYAPELATATADVQPPTLAFKDPIGLTVRPLGPTGFAVFATLHLSPDLDEMVEAMVECRSSGDDEHRVTGRNTIFSRRPRVWAGPLRPATTYEVSVRLVDPYGNAMQTPDAGQILEIQTQYPRPDPKPQVKTFVSWPGKFLLSLYDANVDLGGEVRIRFVPSIDGTLPTLRTAHAQILNSHQFAVGGAALDLREHTHEFPRGQPITVILRWSRYPVMREFLVQNSGQQPRLITSANRLPWDPGFHAGTWIDVAFSGIVKMLRISSEAE